MKDNSKVGRKYVIEIEQEYSANMRKGSSDMVEPVKLYKAKGFNSLVFDEQGLSKLKRVPELEQIEKERREWEEAKQQAYENGLQDAWSLAWRISDTKDNDFSLNDLINIFGIGDATFTQIRRMTPIEVLEKVKKYEENKMQNNTVDVGDEVRLPDNTIGIVVYSDVAERINVFTAYGGVRTSTATQVIKTGKHYDDITNILNSLVLKQKQSEVDEEDCMELSF